MRRAARLELVLVAGLVALVAYVAVVPVAYLAWEAFGGDEGWTLASFREAYATDGLATLAWNSIVFAGGSSLIALVGGTGLALLVTRTDMPLRRVAAVVAVAPLVVPGILYTIAWILIASPRIGLLGEVSPIDTDVFSMRGMIVVEGLHLTSFTFLLMAAAFTSLDPALEEAALMSGARRRTVLRRVTLPLVRPALLAAALVSVVRSLESFEVPVLLGLPAGVPLFTSAIWRALDRSAGLGEAGAFSVSLLALTAVGVFLYSRVARRAARYETVTGRGRRPRRFELGRWRFPALALAGGYLLVASLLPLLILAYASTQRFYSTPSLDGLSAVTLDEYGSLLSNDATARAFANSFVLAAATATALMLAMAVVAWLAVRSAVPGRWALDALVSLPLAVPGLVLGVALLIVYVRVPLPIYGTIWILFLAYFTRFMPYGLRYAASAVHQVGAELEESARTSGARWGQTLRRVTLPLLLPGLLAGWLYVAIVSLRELSSSILLYSPGTDVLAVRIFQLYETGSFGELSALGVVMVLVLAVLAAAAYRVGARLAPEVE
jgi:iron(III) transport system permease protein